MTTVSSKPEDPRQFKTAERIPSEETLSEPNGAELDAREGEQSKYFTKSSSSAQGAGFVPSRRQSAECVSDQDRLNRSRLVEALATVLTGDNNHHQTIGLLGDWGVGKSTTVHLLQKALQRRHQQQPYLFGTFNAWEYEHTNNLQAGMAQEMIKALSSYQPVAEVPTAAGMVARLQQGARAGLWWLGVRLPLLFRFAVALHGTKLLLLALMVLVALLNLSWKDMVDMATRINSAGVGTQMFMGGGAVLALVMLFRQFKSVLAMPLAKEWLTYMKLPDYGEHLGSIPVMRKQIRALCKVRLGSKRRLLFLVDDLDRCGQDGIVKVFEAVRLVLDIPRVTVIIAVDQRIALAALALHYQDLAQHHQLSNPQAIARDYLAKVIHTPITLTPADSQSISGYLDAIWQETSGEGIAEAGGVVASASTSASAPSEQAERGKRPGLSDHQKRIFKKWVGHFGFTNPRQLKRLHNSYNLLRHYYGEDGQLSGGASTTLDAFTSDLGSPMLITLFALEYINSLEDSQLRGRLLQLVKRPRERSYQEEGDAGLAYVDPARKINEDVLQVVTAHPGDGDITFVQAVEPFVLPAIIQDDLMYAELEGEPKADVPPRA